MAEVAIGFVLGVIPLMISTAEHFDDIVQPFKRYRHFHEGVKKFHGSLQTQKTIFRNFCELLLKAFVDNDLAVRILDRKIEVNVELDQQLNEVLGSSADACLRIIEEIETTLCKIAEDKSLELDIQDDEGRRNKDATTKSRLQRASEPSTEPEKETTQSMRNKLLKKALKAKFSVSRKRLEDCLSQLRSLNCDFGTLQAQVQQLAKSQSASICSARRPLSRNIRHFRIVQKSSKQLYEVLAKSCTLHLEHIAHFAVGAEHREPSDTSPLQINFSLALTHKTSQDPHSAEIPLWMVIETTSLDDWSQSTSRTSFLAPGGLMVALKRECNQEAASQSTKRQKKTVRFGTALSIPSHPPLRPPLSAPTATEDVHICKAGNLCTIIRANLRRVVKGKDPDTDPSRTCIGVLDQNDEYRQVVYPLVRDSTLSDLITLSEILSRRLHDHTGAFSQYERIKLARKLATAILQYHATPWLRTGWRSGDVYFFDPAKNNSPKLAAPHFMTKIMPPGRRSVLDTNAKCQPFAFNEVLFGLGVVLLELGHEATLPSMQRSTHLTQIDPNHTAASIEFFESQRLANLVGSRMGSTYGRIVQQCLRCDFGCGSDLDDIALQERVYKDVICKFEDLELKFKGLDMC